KADTIVFLLSPDSVLPTSKCDWEINEAERLSKRIIPVVCRAVPDSDVPGRIRRLNYVFLTPERDRAVELHKLTEALEVDINWIREHSRLGELAARWQALGKGSNHETLRGSAIAEAESWISSRPPKAPEPTEAQRAFIQASRTSDLARIALEQRQIERTRWFQKWFGRALAAAAVILCLGLAGVIWQGMEATARTQAIFLNPIERAMADKQWDRAIRYALMVYPEKGAWPWRSVSSRLEADLGVATLMGGRIGPILRGHEMPLTHAGFS